MQAGTANFNQPATEQHRSSARVWSKPVDSSRTGPVVGSPQTPLKKGGFRKPPLLEGGVWGGSLPTNFDHTRSAPQSIAFIDPGVADWQMLMAGVVPTVEAILLDPFKDGVAQITETLAHRQNIHTVHIISHGSPGSLKLGNSFLSISTLDKYIGDWQQWRQALKKDPAILLYGCHVAAGKAGKELIAKLHRLTGASVAGSARATGNKALGGDWNLEVTTGEVSASPAFKSQVMAAYPGIFLELELSSLDGTNGFTLNGIDAADRSGWSVSSAGDVNGDGFDDLIIGASEADPNGNSNAGESYVVFGSNSSGAASLELNSLDGTNGFTINGIDLGDNSGNSVSSAGDVNGDGIDDLIIGAFGADPNGKNSAGESYVVFGRNSGWTASLELSSLDGTNGFTLNGIDTNYYSGHAVSSAGDVNGDGIDDLIIGAPFANPNGKYNAGESYVVFGSNSGWAASLELSSLNGTNGFTLNGIDAFDNSGNSVSSAGDVNGDGIDDLIIGAYQGDPNGNSGAGESYVVFGSNSGWAASLDLSSLDGTNGFTLNGIDADDSSGVVSSAGDVNGDGFDDLIIGARGGDPNGKSYAGESYVVFGRDSAWAASLDLSSLDGTNGFTLNGIDAEDYSGDSVSSAGDVNGDGFDDLIIGAQGADPNGNAGAGESYVVFGRNSGWAASLELSSINGTNGFTINGIDGGDNSGYSVSSVGDVNGDGFDDLIIGAGSANPNGNAGAGESYVVFGFANAREIDVQGNAMSIRDADSTPTTADHTDFGGQEIAEGTLERTFTITNAGTGGLTLGADAVTISGTDAADFTVTTQPATTVASGGSTTFVLSFYPSTPGVKNASVSINNDDSDENPYNFDIQGTGDVNDITGSSGQDAITGTDGPDRITGGTGRDTVTGNGGTDIFVYTQYQDGGDTITDFTPGEDKIDVSGVMEQIGYSGSDPVGDGYIDFAEWNDDTILLIDVDGSATRARPRGYILMKEVAPDALDDVILTASGGT